MNPRTPLEAAAAALLGAAVEIDDIGTELELSRCRVTLVGRALKLGSLAVVASAILAIGLVELSRSLVPSRTG